MSMRLLANDRELKEPFLVILSGWTEDDYFRLAPESRLCEFVRGEVFMHSHVLSRHDDLVFFLRSLLDGFLRERGLGLVKGGPYTMRLEPGLDYEPDLFVVKRERAAALTLRCLEGPADLVIEVVSSGTRTHDLERKRGDYERHGVSEYWAVDDERRRVVVFHRDEGRFVETVQTEGRIDSTSLPGFWIDLSWLTQDPLSDPRDRLREILGE